MNELTHVDLFSGIGGFALAAEWGGYRTVCFSEVEPYACKVLAERWPGVPNVGDVRIAANFARFRGATVLTGGFPCQPWSAAGKRGGANDDRHLWPAMLRVIETVRPAWIIGENVPGLDHMGQLDACCDDLAALGYESQPFEISACAVDAPHLRDRLWIVAHAGCKLRGAIRAESEQDQPGANLHDKRCREDVAHASRIFEGRPDQRAERERVGAGGESGDVADPGDERCQERGRIAGMDGAPARARTGFGPERDSWWLAEPDVGRVAHGIPNRAHRLKGLGNSIVPQVVAPFFRWIKEIEKRAITG